MSATHTSYRYIIHLIVSWINNYKYITIWNSVMATLQSQQYLKYCFTKRKEKKRTFKHDKYTLRSGTAGLYLEHKAVTLAGQSRSKCGFARACKTMEDSVTCIGLLLVRNVDVCFSSYAVLYAQQQNCEAAHHNTGLIGSLGSWYLHKHCQYPPHKPNIRHFSHLMLNCLKLLRRKLHLSTQVTPGENYPTPKLWNWMRDAMDRRR